jgi:hypothetical protein
MVEFALIGPLFFASLFLMVQVALLFNAQSTLDNAAREASRVAALCGGSKATWTGPDGVRYSSGVWGSPCIQAADQTVANNLGILPTINSVTETNPHVYMTAPASGSASSCGPIQSTGNYQNATAGCEIDVQISYDYKFFFNFIVGPSAPKITLTSEASTLSQQ